jgi:ribosomal protein S11
LTTGSNSLSSYGQQVATGIKAIAAKYTGSAGSGSGGSGGPVTPVTPSANGTVVMAGSTAVITDASGNKWTINSSGQVAVNGTADTSTAGVKELAYVSGTVWQENASNLWWGKASPTAAWSPAAGTSTSPVTGVVTPPPSSASANDTVVLAGTTAAITDAGGNKWSITSGGQVAVNGTTDASTAGVKELAYVDGKVWQENTSNVWWGKTSPTAAWSPTAGSSTSPLPTTTPPSTTASIAVRLSEDAYQGDAQFTVKVDGTQVGGTMTASALHSSGDSNVFVLNGNWATGSHQVAIQFLNDAYGGTATTDRNLYVDSVAYSGKTESGTTASLMSNATQTFAVSSTAATVSGPADTVTVHLSEDAYSGNAQFKLLVDGKVVTTAQDVVASHAAGAWQDLSFSGNFGTGSHTVGVQFTNDAYGGTAATDRNLYVNGIDVNGTHYGSGVTALLSSTTANFAITTAH